MRRKDHIYHITLSNGELLKDIRVKGSLEWNFSGVAVNLISAENEAGKTIVLSKYHIVKAELISIGE